jgi:hypothetical protein
LLRRLSAPTFHDPPFDPSTLPRALQVIARAKDVSHPDTAMVRARPAPMVADGTGPIAEPRSDAPRLACGVGIAVSVRVVREAYA